MRNKILLSEPPSRWYSVLEAQRDQDKEVKEWAQGYLPGESWSWEQSRASTLLDGTYFRIMIRDSLIRLFIFLKITYTIVLLLH